MTDNRKPSSIRGHAANDCPGIDECGQASSMHEQLSELTAAQARQESQLRILHTGHQHLAQQLAHARLHNAEARSERAWREFRARDPHKSAQIDCGQAARPPGV